MLRSYFSFDGRFSRRQYFIYFTAIHLVVVVVATQYVLTKSSSASMEEISKSIDELFLYTAISRVALGIMPGIKRLHDLGVTGWLVVLSAVPVLGYILFFILQFVPGTEGMNKYGSRASEKQDVSSYQP